MQIPDIPSEKELEFALFCIDYVARALGQDPTEIYQKLNESRLLENYLVKNYEVLHTLGKDYLVEDIINLFAKTLNISLGEALHKFIYSNTYLWMREGIGDFHCLSDGYLVDELLLEYPIKKSA